MTQASGVDRVSGFVIGILLTYPEQLIGRAIEEVEKAALSAVVRIDIAVQNQELTMLSYAQALQENYRDDHILVLHESVYIPFGFLDDVRSLIQHFEDSGVSWGVLGNSGISFPYFKPVSNMLIAGASIERFAGAVPAAHLDPYVLLIHRDVRLSTFVTLSECPIDAPLNDLVGFAAWEAGKPCWICNLPVYASGSDPTFKIASSEWVRYLSNHYSNPSFVSSFGTIESIDHVAGARDYYYGQVEPVLQTATTTRGKASLSVFLFATYYDVDVFDRCLMSVVSQFQRPERVYLIGLARLDSRRRPRFAQVIERYRHYVIIDWSEEDFPDKDAHSQLALYLKRAPEHGYSLWMYDTYVLFPHAVHQICEFFQICIGGDVLPITTAEISRLQRTVESHIPSQPRAFFREIEKFGFDHKRDWLSSQPSAILHYTFPNLFLIELNLSDIDLWDLGSCLPQRLLSQPYSFFLIERGAGYISFQKPSLDETVCPLKEECSPFHLANKAKAFLTSKSNVLQYSICADVIAVETSFQDRGEAARRDRSISTRLGELEAYRSYAELELARLQQLAQQQDLVVMRQNVALKQQEVAFMELEMKLNVLRIT